MRLRGSMVFSVYKIPVNNGVRIILKDRNNTKISECRVASNNGIWSITEWFTEGTFRNQGYGTRVLKEALLSLLEEYGVPDEIRYNWNGVNEYVYLWLEKKFNAQPFVPEFQRYEEDEKSYHIYILDKQKVLSFVQEEL